MNLLDVFNRADIEALVERLERAQQWYSGEYGTNQGLPDSAPFEAADELRVLLTVMGTDAPEG